MKGYTNMTVLERRHAFYQNLRDYIAEIREQAMIAQDDTLYDASCILAHYCKETDNEKALLKELKSFRSLLDSRYPLSMLLERENRHQIRNHMSTIIQAIEQLWIGTKP